ncbi:MAG: glycosyltransferase family 39 protein [Kiritimatiellaeota bacterium]|nr:glycosyltransferase family 39 protein [Kiritimatiellota bacterium]
MPPPNPGQSTIAPPLFSAKRRRILGLVLAFCFALCFLDRPAFWGKYTESRRAEIAREMFEESGDWLVPTLLGKRILTKPPGAYWLQTLGFRVTGRVDDVGARLPSAVLALLALGCAYLAGRRWKGSETGWLAAGILLTSYLFLNNVRSAEIDMAFSSLITVEYCLLVLACQATAARRRQWLFTGFWVVAGLAFMVKGPLALVFPLLGLVWARIALWRAPDVFRLKPVFANPGPVLFMLISLPWYLYLVWKHPETLLVFTRETVGRLGGHTRHMRGPLYYFEQLTALAPWVLFLPPVGTWAWKQREKVPALQLGTFAAGFLLLTVLRSKKEVSLLPLLPAWALLVAGWIDEVSRNRSRRPAAARYLRICLGVLGVVVALAAVGGAGVVIWQPRRPTAVLAALLFGGVALAAAATGPIRGLRKPSASPARSTEWLVISLIAVAVLGVQWLLPTLDAQHSVRNFARETAKRVPQSSPLAAYGIENYAISFYARRIVPGPLADYRLRNWNGWVIAPADAMPRLEKLGECEIKLRNRDLAGGKRLKSSYDLFLVRFRRRDKTP